MIELLEIDGKICNCKKLHKKSVKEVIVGKGKICEIIRVINDFGAKKPFIFGDNNTFNVCGNELFSILKNADINFTKFVLSGDKLEPDEKAINDVLTNFNSSCDIIVAVGSGVINDLGKILSKEKGKPFIIVATAPSMDGYASNTSSVLIDGRKVSLSTRSADVIIGDTNVLKSAPDEMLKAGLGDMLAKYVSILEWRISNLINGEYYCEKIANLVKRSLKKCVDNAKALLNKDEKAIEHVFNGLIVSGIAMEYAGLSRPASGVEHYVSHIIDMRGAELKKPVSLHGLQCGVATLYAVRLYERLKKIVPDEEKAKRFVNDFDLNKWFVELKDLLKDSANSLIEAEKTEKKYDKLSHEKRLKQIVKNWDKILTFIDEELPSSKEIETILDQINAPKTLEEIGTSESLFNSIFKATKDIRDKYVLSRLCFDLGVLDDILN